MSEIDIIVLDTKAVANSVPQLAEVLADCVNGGASVNFMLPYSSADAAKFFNKIIPSIATGETILLAARIDGRIVGTVQLGMDTPPNQPHRGEIKKLLVHRVARGKGVGAALMSRIEAIAKEKGRTLLILDTASDDARRLYERGAGRNSATFRTMRYGRRAVFATRRFIGRSSSAKEKPRRIGRGFHARPLRFTSR